PFAVGNVVVGFQGSDRAAVLILLQRPPARRDDLRPVPLAVNELSLPAARLQHYSSELFERCGGYGVQKLMRFLADGLVPRPTIQLLGAAIPVRNQFVSVAHENGVVGEPREDAPFP